MQLKIIKSLSALLLIAVGFLGFTPFKKQEDKSMKVVAISQLVEHPALDETYRGIIDELRDGGYIDGQTMKLFYELAQGSATTAAQIAQKFSGINPDVMVGIATISSQALASANRGKAIPIVFSSITDPVGAQLVKDLKNTADSSITGMSNWVEIEPQLEKFKQILPSLKKLGFVYNPGEGNSLVLLNRIRAAGKKMGIEVLEAPATLSAEVGMATENIAGKVDAIFISNDNTALSAFPCIVKVANKAQIPVFVSDTDMVKDGAVSAVGPSQYQVGRQTGRMILQILDGAPPSTIPVGFPEKLEFYLNTQAMDTIGLKVSNELKALADKVL